LVCLFGETATQNPAQPFHRHFAQRLRHALRTFRGAENPFLWQMIGGGFPKDHPYDWLRSRGPLLAKPIFIHGQMREALDSLPARSMTLVHLSNILDWLPPQEAAALLHSAARVLQSKGHVIIRQLNSSLDIPALGGEFFWDHALSQRLTTRDRSFFYTTVHVGRKS
jgi:S-adenosylmethionine-diacylglycerol 3-amino-3-carboxypropyl transferase